MVSDIVIKPAMGVERKGRLPRTIEEGLGLAASLGNMVGLYLCLYACWPYALFHFELSESDVGETGLY